MEKKITNQRKPENTDNNLKKARKEFRKVFDDKGYSIDEEHPIFDGKRHSLTVNGKENAGWYKIITNDPGPAGFILLRDEKTIRWLSSEYKEKQESAGLKAGKMVQVIEKLKRYFGDHEFGIFKEAENGKDGAVWAVAAEPKNVNYLKAMNAQGKHIFIRPSFEKESHFMMHDDLDRAGLAKYHQDANGKWKPGRLVVESSPGNYQVWIKTDRPLSVEEKKYWLDKMKSDPGASPLHRWGRAPGFRNRKKKYKTEKGFPLARFEWIDWKNQAKIPKVEFKKEPDPSKSLSPSQQRHSQRVSRSTNQELPYRSKYYKGVDAKGKVMESEQDFAYMLALIRRGVPEDEVKRRVLDERADWSNHEGPRRKDHYLTTTYNAAKAIVEASPQNTQKKQRKPRPPRISNSKKNKKFKVTVKCNEHILQENITVGKDVEKVNEFLEQKAKLFAAKLIKDNKLQENHGDITATITEMKQSESKTMEVSKEF
ncbi:hypothetical protein DSCO28_73190 (plasmid) [Desulfosarcina ovata subsp. sediminis]|uniref:RepB-like DNA primase domain-containing protein n=1 Tax=Desulfosarcina ovata subsp. sediminis TaxID=885957 RepID=A0A5K8A2H8_9BACT|nr:DNA-primase RepB domain-containing protein [Desulfosarcina ovata]BBO86753.1 hypothetical protein DSCO28_73190 [Desulfosarcina ovata subsp. sediminis]